ncbi:uncharacterized protein LOC111193358 [Astyanax mexicanus]|uniref:uncharacterized protein LOC111193358 n=1 Tax=Astyanax mexicanus TaxID=7994 RepID=UPI0020CAA608|nr:uncharacterized protein LOC111193358 [Astyanax mexicanus]
MGSYPPPTQSLHCFQPHLQGMAARLWWRLRRQNPGTGWTLLVQLHSVRKPGSRPSPPPTPRRHSASQMARCWWQRWIPLTGSTPLDQCLGLSQVQLHRSGVDVLVLDAEADPSHRLDTNSTESEPEPVTVAQAEGDLESSVEVMVESIETAPKNKRGWLQRCLRLWRSTASTLLSCCPYREESDVFSTDTSPFSSCPDSSVEDLTTTVFSPALTSQGVTAPIPTVRTQGRPLKRLAINLWTSVFSRFRSRFESRCWLGRRTHVWSRSQLHRTWVTWRTVWREVCCS